MADAGIRLQVEGEKEFKAALAACDTAVKNNQKSLKLLTEEFKLNATGMKDAQSGIGSMADAAAILADKGKVLADSIVVQTEKVGLLDQRVQEAAQAYGEHDKRTEALRAQLLDASAALTKLTTEQEKNRQAILDAQNSTKEYEDAVTALTAAIDANDAELKVVGGGMDTLKKKTGDLQTQNQLLQKQNEILTDSIGKQLEKTDMLSKAQETAAKRFGEGSKEVEEYRKRLADATKQLNDMESELQENQKAIEENNKAIESGGEAPTKMIDGLKVIEDLTGVKIPNGITSMISGFESGTLAVGTLATKLAEVYSSIQKSLDATSSWAAEITTKAAELDMNVEEYQVWEAMAEELQVDFGVLEKAITTVNKKAGESVIANRELQESYEAQIEKVNDANRAYQEASDAYDQAIKNYQDQLQFVQAYTSNIELITQHTEAERKAVDDAQKAYDEASAAYQEANTDLEDMKEQLGDGTVYWEKYNVALTDAEGNIRDSKEIFYDLIDVFREMPDDLSRSTEMSELFGRSYSELKPLLSKSSEGLRELEEQIKENNTILTEGDIATQNYIEQQKQVADHEYTQQIHEANVELRTTGNLLKYIFDLIDAKGERWQKLHPIYYADPDDLEAKISGHYAEGTAYHPGGLALVGERGPELVELPRGSAVYPNGTYPGSTTNSTVNNITYNMTIDAKNVQEFNDLVRMAQSARVSMRRN